MNSKVVSIDLDSRSYDIYIGRGLLYRMPDFMPDEVEGRSLFVICDQNTQNRAQQLQQTLENSDAKSCHLLTLEPGEKTKSFDHVEHVCNWLLDNKLSRDSLIFAVGGGVIGDLVGFCAAIVARGVPFIQVPTTLLAMVDSAVGGKTGINTGHGKNLIGAFYQPAAVVADIEVLDTLPERQFLAGYAEIVKYGLIGDSAFFNWLEQNGAQVCARETEALAHAIEVSVKAKAKVVQADERESGYRALLNLGHTFGHALELAAGYDGRLLHGEAVAIGMVMAYDLSMRMGKASSDDLERAENHLKSVGLPTRAYEIDPVLQTSIDALLSFMQTDKKVKRGQIQFIVPNTIGDAEISTDVDPEALRAVLHDSLGGEVSGDSKKRIKGLWKSTFSSL